MSVNLHSFRGCAGIAGNVFGLCVRCLCALARVSESNDAKPVLYAAFLSEKYFFENVWIFKKKGCIFVNEIKKK